MITLTIAAPTEGEVRAHFEAMASALIAAGYSVATVEYGRDPDRAGMLSSARLVEDPAVRVKPPSAWQDVLDERVRQIDAEHWSAAHDDTQVDGELVEAAICYAMTGIGQDASLVAGGYWPDEWSLRHWKPTNRRRDLVKAGALILAEIDRLDRADTARKEGGAA